ncbi:sulfite exporter TauE/SafE family protein [Synechococcus sp. CS-1328]|uniref:sulfite exporter TauE/SafE family protein n=1 Tax=Synechococcus sp. CS-1328 TaxID=2847976 RepID=UPI00223AE856|nr:sulfite exporter TauE/SafE family protein [Synechococcus sp. CS-1328]MCT0225178.1 sulfite exporter TauE/SafE family protein [Synechococcus sp. CS-1328]
MSWTLLALVPLGLLAGLLSGLLGIGGGLIFSPILLLIGLEPHQALATSSLAIVPTTLAGTWTHLRSGQLPRSGGVAIAAGAAISAALFSRLGQGLEGWMLLGLQALMYVLLAITIEPKDASAPHDSRPLPLAGLASVGGVAGLAGGLLGVGGGLIMVPLMVKALQVPIRLAIRFSTLGVLVSSSAASVAFLQDGRGQLLLALLLGGTAALAAQWSAGQLNRFSESSLAWMLRGLALLLAIDSSRRALMLLLAG